MAEYLAFLAGKLFLFFFNICGRLDYDMAVNLISSMYHTLERERLIKDTQDNYRKAVDG